MIIATILLSLMVSWFLVTPFLEGVTSPLTQGQDEHSMEYERTLQMLEDLEGDYRSGVVDENTYRLSREDLVQRAAVLLAQVDARSAASS